MSAHVLLILPVLNPSGAERVVAELGLRLPQHGFTTSVLCLEDERAQIGIELVNAGVTVRGLRISRRRTLTCAQLIAEHIQNFFRNQPLIVCAHLFHANIAARLAMRHFSNAERKLVHVFTTIQVAERRIRPWQFWLDRWSAKYCASEICVAKSVAEFQRAKTGLPESFFPVIENAIDVSRFQNLPERILNSKRPFRVVAVGRLNAQKDYPTLLRAWKIVESHTAEATLEIAGSGPELQRLQTLSTHLKLANISFRGFCADVREFLAGANLFVQSSAWEGLPLSVIEAMCVGLPVIASAVDSLPDMIDDRRTGFLFPRGDHRSLAAKIIDAMMRPDQSRAIGLAARDVALKRFSAERMTAEYAHLFQKTLSQMEPGF